MTDTPKTRKPRLTVEEAWGDRPRALLVLAEADDKRDIIVGAHNAADREVLLAKAAKYDALANEARLDAEDCVDHRDAVLETLRKRAADLIK